MMSSVEKTGKTVDAAVFAALEELGVTIDEVIVEVLEEGDNGILGIGRKPARVLVTLDQIDESLARSDLPDEDDERQYDYEHADLNSENFQDPGMLSNEDLEEDADYLRRSSKEYYGDHEDYGDQEDEELVAAAREYMENILDALDIPAELQIYVQDGKLYVDVDGEDVGALIGRRGETLHALQYLLSVSLPQTESREHRRVVLDVAGYRGRREKALEALALRTAERVVRVGKEYVMEDMPAVERRVIHATLQNHPGVRTTSEGQEPHRYVVLIPLNKERHEEQTDGEA